MSDLRALLNAYITALNAGASDVGDVRARNLYMASLSAAGEMRQALDCSDIGRIASILHTETHSLGWDRFAGTHGNEATEAFRAFSAAVKAERLRDAPDAQF